jgi:hypothetical protein
MEQKSTTTTFTVGNFQTRRCACGFAAQTPVFLCLLTLGQPGQTTASSGALYPDEGSAYEVWYENVVTDIGASEWLHIWTASIHNITVRNNYADTHTFENHGTF